MVTKDSIPHRIPLKGSCVFARADGKAMICFLQEDQAIFPPIFPDQSFLEIVRLREQARSI